MLSMEKHHDYHRGAEDVHKAYVAVLEKKFPQYPEPKFHTRTGTCLDVLVHGLIKELGLE